MCKIFIIFNFRRWSQPRKLNTDHTLYVTLRTSTVGTATMDTHRTLEKERRDKLILLGDKAKYHRELTLVVGCQIAIAKLLVKLQ